MKCLPFVALILLIFSANSPAGILTVTTAEDTNDGICDAHCSLREAISASADVGTIIFARSLRGAVIELRSTLLIDINLTIDGPNRRRITLKGNRTFRILYIKHDVNDIRAVIDGLIIRDGAAPGGWGGGIRMDGGEMLILSNCLIADNHAEVGGGIWAYVHNSLELINTTIANNTSDGQGGAAGIQAYLPYYIRTFNSTITGNRAGNGTGGILVRHATVPSEFVNTTITDNHSSGSDTGQSGGITGHFTFNEFYNTIVAGNTGPNPDVFSGSGQNNFIGNYEGSGFVNGVNGNIVGNTKNPADPRLGRRSNRDGGLGTFALLPDSRAINAGRNEHFLQWLGYPYWLRPTWSISDTDQRGFQRFVDKSIDMGAVEYGASQISVPRTILGRLTTDTGRGVSGARVTIRDAMGETRMAITNPFGHYRFTGLPTDVTYTVEVTHKTAAFQPQTITTEEVEEYVDFTSVTGKLRR